MIRRMSSETACWQSLRVLILMAALLCITAVLIGGVTPALGQVTSEPDPIAQEPYLVKDIITTTKGIAVTYAEEYFASVNGYLFLSIDDGDHGYELWKSDGSESGTMLVKDIEPEGSSAPQYLLEFNEVLYFAATDYEHGNELWKSDGTEAGTVMIKDLNPGLSPGIPGFSYGPGLMKYKGNLYFNGNDGVHGEELWKSDGTESGTVLVKDIYPGGDDSGPYSSSPHNLMEVDGSLFFVVSSSNYSFGLWKSDGTEAGTMLVKDISPAQPSIFSVLTPVGNTLYFAVDGGQYGCELWKSDGTEAGTMLVKPINPNYESCGRNLTDHDGMLYFTVEEELWKSDGTEAGTQIVKDIYPGTGEWNAGLQSLTSMGEALYFGATDGINSCELWKSDGTEAGTTPVISFEYINEYDYCVTHLTDFNGELFFSVDDGVHGRDLWKSDGTVTGTVMVKDIQTGGINCWYEPKIGERCYVPTQDHLTVAGDMLFFISDHIDHGAELWKSDGTEPGTLLVKDINTDTDDIQIDAAASMDDVLYFAADDGVHGMELWKSDGTESGTGMVTDLNTIGSSAPSDLTPFTGELYFAAADGTHGVELWKSDGTEAGTARVVISPDGPWDPTGLTVFNGALYFSATGIHGTELWKSDGTEAGTAMVKDISPEGSSQPVNLVESNGSLYFSAWDSEHGYELWESDGTEAGTVLVKDIYPGYISSGPYGQTGLNGTLIFAARDADHGVELWRSDGTEAGTSLTKDITPNDSAYPYQFPGELTPSHSILYFSADDGILGADLWKSDGTEEGTVMVKDIHPEFLTDANGVLFFGGSGNLWKSDGSEDGTVVVKNISPWIGYSVDERISNPIAINGVLFLAADDWTHGTELWKSDGTEAGTVMVADINPGVDEYGYGLSSNPAWLTDVNGTLFFFADDGEHGRELWAYKFITSRLYMPMLLIQ